MWKPKVFKREEDEEFLEPTEEYLELQDDMGEDAGQLKIMIEKLEGYSNVDKILKKVRDGNIVFVRIKELKEANMDELKHAVSRIKNICTTFDGDIAGVGEEWLIVTPPVAKIVRQEF